MNGLGNLVDGGQEPCRDLSRGGHLGHRRVQEKKRECAGEQAESVIHVEVSINKNKQAREAKRRWSGAKGVKERKREVGEEGRAKGVE